MNTRGKRKVKDETLSPNRVKEIKLDKKVGDDGESDEPSVDNQSDVSPNRFHVSVKSGSEPSEDWLTQLSKTQDCQQTGDGKQVITVNLVVNLPEHRLFKCGLCELMLPSISLLHKHILAHDDCTSFEFFYDTCTAYPRYETGEELEKKKTVSYGQGGKMNVKQLSQIKTIRKKYKKKKNKDDVSDSNKKGRLSADESDPNEPEADNDEGNQDDFDIDGGDDAVGSCYMEQDPSIYIDKANAEDEALAITENLAVTETDEGDRARDKQGSNVKERNIAPILKGEVRLALKTKAKKSNQIDLEESESQTTDKPEADPEKNSSEEGKAADKVKSPKKGTVRVKAIIKEDGIETDEDGDDDNSDDDFLIEYSLDGTDKETKKRKSSRPKVDPNTLVKCMKCDKQVKYSQLKDHNAWAHEVQDCECDKCGKQFLNKYKLRMHKRTHSFNFTCELCPKKYSRKEDLQRHMDWHKGVKRFECPECNMKFAAKSALRKHTSNIHKGLKPFVCHICGKPFAGMSSHQVHMLTHYEPTLPCRFCDRSFRLQQQLEKHENKHLENKLFECHICEHKATVSVEYYNHMVKNHRIDRNNIKNAMKLIYEYHHRKYNQKPVRFRIPENFEEMLAELKAMKSVSPSPVSGIDLDTPAEETPVDIPGLKLGKDNQSEEEIMHTPMRKLPCKLTSTKKNLASKPIVTPTGVPVSEIIKIKPVLNEGKPALMEGVKKEAVEPGAPVQDVAGPEECQYILEENLQNQTVVLSTDDNGVETQTIVLSNVEGGLTEDEEQVVMLPPNINPSDIDNIMVYNDKGQLIKLVKWNSPTGEETDAIVM